jgi:hypothetical protein
MKIAGWILLTSTAAAMAYPSPDPSALVIDKPDAATVHGEWLASTSYLVGQLHAVAEMPLVPTVPKPADESAAGTPSLAEARSTALGFQVDLDLDGKYDEFLPIPLPPMLGTAYNPERNDSSKIAATVFSLAIPDAGPASDGSLWLQALSESQKVQIVDAGALVRRRSQASSADPEPKSPEKWAHLPGLSIGWLAVLLGAGVFLWQRRLVQRQISSA